MEDLFEEYGSIIIAVIAGIFVLGIIFAFTNENSFLSEWIAQYTKSIGG